MRIDRSYKGVSEPTLILFDDGMCDGPEMRLGEQFLMYTYRNGDGEVPARGCTRSRHVKYAEEDLKYLDGLNEAPPTGSVFGQVGIWRDGPGMIIQQRVRRLRSVARMKPRPLPPIARGTTRSMA
jgi:hypothetical protein